MLPDGPPQPVLQVASFSAPPPRWNLDWDVPLTSIPAVPTLADWVVFQAGVPVNPTSIVLSGGNLRLLNAAYNASATLVGYAFDPAQPYEFANGAILAGFSSPLPV